MDYITTTQLRTKSSELVKGLKNGDSVYLVHRSKTVGIIKPAREEAPPIDLEKFRKFLKSIRPQKLIPRSQREAVYRKHMMEKYGKGIS